jgi:hypothetical protein
VAAAPHNRVRVRVRISVKDSSSVRLENVGREATVGDSAVGGEETGEPPRLQMVRWGRRSSQAATWAVGS